MSHDEIRGLASGYALSALDPDDLKDFEAHLASCPECRADLAELRPLVDALSKTVEEREPDHGLRSRILASARAEMRAPVQPAKPAPWWRRPVLWPLPVAAVVTALAVAVAVVSVLGSQTGDDLSSSERRLSLTYDGLEIMAVAGQWWRFDGSPAAPGVAGTLAYSEGMNAACLLIWGMPEGDEFVYQVRLTDSAGQVSTRRMWRYNNAMWLIIDGDPGLYQRLEVLAAGDSSASPGLPALIDIPLASS